MEEKDFMTENENYVDVNDESTTESGKSLLGPILALGAAIVGGTILYKKVIKPRRDAKKAAKKQLPVDAEYEVLTDDDKN